jgi:hypothetical protein
MTTVRTDGAHLWNSSTQLVNVERGTMTRKGPCSFFFSIRYVMSEIVWIVFPRPWKVSNGCGAQSMVTHHLVGKDTIQSVVVQTDHPLQTLDLVVLQSTARKDRRLASDLLLYAVGHGVVVDLSRLGLGVLFLSVLSASSEHCLVRRSILDFERRHRASRITVNLIVLLLNDSGSKGLEVLVGLLEQMTNTRVFGISEQGEISVFVVILERLETFFRESLNSLGLFPFGIGMQLLHGPSKSLEAISGRPPMETMAYHCLAVVADGLNVRQMTLLAPLLPLRSLSTLSLFRLSCVPERVVSEPTELASVRRNLRGRVHGSDHVFSEQALFADQAELQQLDPGFDAEVRVWSFFIRNPWDILRT